MPLKKVLSFNLEIEGRKSGIGKTKKKNKIYNETKI